MRMCTSEQMCVNDHTIWKNESEPYMKWEKDEKKAAVSNIAVVWLKEKRIKC